MSDDLGPLLSRTFQEHAATVPDPRQMADAARHRARAIVRRRVAGVVAVTVGVVATGLVAASVTAVDRADSPPAERAPEVRLTTPPGARTAVSLDGLSAGAAPRVGWLDGDVFHHSAGHDVPLPIGATIAVEHGEGTVAVRDSEHPALYLLDAAGTATVTAIGNRPVAAPGGRAGYLAQEEGSLVVLPSETSDGWSAELEATYRSTPVGFLADGRLVVEVEPATDGGRATYLLAGPDRTSRWRGDGAVRATDPGGTAIGVVTPGRSPCIELWPTPAGPASWRACPPPSAAAAATYPDVAGFSPDGDLLLVRGPDPGGRGTRHVAVVDVASGTVVHELAAGDQAVIGQALLESDDTVLLAVWEGGRRALVRCAVEVGTGCETATDPTPVSRTDWAPAPMAPQR